MANKIDINDFDLFFEYMKSVAKLVDSAKFLFSPSGLEIYGARGNAARCEMTTNSVSSADTFDLCVDNLSTFNRVLSTVKDVHKDDFSELKITYNKPNLNFASKKMKMKYSTCNEAAISKWIVSKITAKMTPIFEFKTTSDLIKRINGHGFLFADSKTVNVYLETKDDMEQNSVFATIGNKNVDLGKEITLKFGLVTQGSIPENRKIVIDLERMNLFNCVQSDNINIGLMDKNCLLSNTKIQSKSGSYLNIDIYCSILKG